MIRLLVIDDDYFDIMAFKRFFKNIDTIELETVQSISDAIDKIKKSDIEDFQIWLREKFNINSVKNIRGVLSLILQSLLGDGIILYNPMKNVKLPKLNKKNI